MRKWPRRGRRREPRMGLEEREAQEGLEEEECSGGMARIRKPEEPAHREFEEHMVLHMLVRAWCPHCVKGRANSEPHRIVRGKEEETVPTISMDYMWRTSKSESKMNEDNGDTELRGMPILVIKDSKSGFIDANVVPQTGECVFATNCGVSLLYTWDTT